MDRLVDIKKINIIILKNAITKPILEKFYEMFNELKTNYDNYEDSVEMKNLLKQFQFALSHITNWDDIKRKEITDELITKLNNDRNKKKYSELHIENLIKTIIKSNLEIFYYNFPEKINTILYEEFNIPNFINEIFILCARKFHEEPYLFMETKDKIKRIQNKNIVKSKIEQSLDEAILETFDINELNTNFLQDKLKINKINSVTNNLVNQNIVDNLNNNFSKNQESFNNIQSINNQQLLNNQQIQNGGNNFSNDNIIFTNNDVKKSIEHEFKNEFDNILKEKEIKLSDSNRYKSESSLLSHLTKENNSINNLKINNENHQSSEKQKKIKDLLENDLKETENKEMYNAEDDTEKYREVFSNSINTESKKKFDLEDSDIKNTSDKNKMMSKNKFFNNYLNL